MKKKLCQNEKYSFFRVHFQTHLMKPSTASQTLRGVKKQHGMGTCYHQILAARFKIVDNISDTKKTINLKQLSKNSLKRKNE